MPPSVPKVAPNMKIPDTPALRAKPVSGGIQDTDRVRIVKGFYANISDARVFNLDVTDERAFDDSLNQEFDILTYTVPEARMVFIDSIEFFARPVAGNGLIPAGIVEGAVELYFTIGGVVPLTLSSVRTQPGLQRRQRSFVPFLNSNIGPTQFTFSLQAKTGQLIRAYYFNLIASPVAIRYIGARIRGWSAETSIMGEILEQQR
jgi:hypothetical protein